MRVRRLPENAVRGCFLIPQIQPVVAIRILFEKTRVDTAPCAARIDATRHEVAVQAAISATRVLLVAERVRIPVEPVELVQPIDRHERLEVPDVRLAVE